MQRLKMNFIRATASLCSVILLISPLMLFPPQVEAHEGTLFYDSYSCGGGWGTAAATLSVPVGGVEAANIAENAGYLGFEIHVDGYIVCGVRRDEHWIQTVCLLATILFWADSIPCRWYIQTYAGHGWH
ncbi:hypothetical protein [Candidatus Foliamicus sp.]